MGYNAVQKQVLEALLDQYERSKTYQGENKVIQSFQIPPEKVFPDYGSDYADMDQIRDFEAWMRELEQDGLIERHVLPENLRVEYHLTEYGSTLLPILDAVYDWGWHDMKKKDIPIDPLGEMWHGYRKQDASRMHQPFKKK